MSERSTNKQDLAGLTQRLMTLLKVPVTDKFSEELRLRPEYPTLLSVSNSLREINVKNLVVSLAEEQLGEIPFPCIAQTRSEDAAFVIIRNISDGRVDLSTERQQEISMDLADFSKDWTGVLLVAEPTSLSGDVNFKENTKLEFLSRVRHISTASLFIALVALILFLNPSFAIPILLSSTGLVFCIALVMQSLGQDSLLSAAVCGVVADTDCKAVVNSPVAKIYGDISLAEIALLFFAGTFMSDIILLTAGRTPLNPHLFLLFILSAPVSLFSIYYQWKIIKQWCPLCLGVIAVLLSMSLFYVSQISNVSFSIEELPAVATGFLICLLIWFVIRRPIFEAGKTTSLKRSLYKFSKSQIVFDALQERWARLSTGLDDGIVVGNPLATNSITFVSNPLCGPCIEAHHEIDSWLNQCGDDLKISFRFAVNPEQNGSVANTIARNLISLALSGEKTKMQEAMTSWYSRERPEVDQWLSSLPAALNPETESEFLRHYNWCQTQNIRTVPAVFFNDRQIPNEFLFKDFENILKIKLSEV